jgi:xeroderma pigmentosum group C-complementing protein
MADTVIQGKIPKNNFGNLDLYVPTMLPRGAVHVPCKLTSPHSRDLLQYADCFDS